MINLGLATYGRSFTLRDRNNHDVGASIRGPGDAGRFTGEKGFISYYEVLLDNCSSYVHIRNSQPSRIDDLFKYVPNFRLFLDKLVLLMEP